MTVVTARNDSGGIPGMAWKCHAERGCVMPNEAMSCRTRLCHAERDHVMLNLIQHLSYRGAPESSSG